MRHKGHRLLVFVTTSKASVLKMLEVDMDFAKKVAVPAISNLNELGAVLQKSRMVSPDMANHAVESIHRRTGTSTVGVGIKTILDNIFEAKAGGPESMLETFTDLVVESIQENSAA